MLFRNHSSSQILRAHLRGQLTLGVYPLLPGETCWFVAVDFDKATWREDCAAFREIGRGLRIDVAVERSRSGKGAHAWIFFQKPLEACQARQLATVLLTRTMETHYQLGLDSYDRLFPSQDTLPKGGFGNLIALPLQGESRRTGNTVFLDNRLEPYEDQWLYLTGVRRIDRALTQEVISRFRKGGPLIGIRRVSGDDSEKGLSPALLGLSQRGSEPRLEMTGTQIQIEQANRLFLNKAKLPAGAINQLIRLASFQNPEFYRSRPCAYLLLVSRASFAARRLRPNS